MTTDAISLETAYEMDNQWVNASADEADGMLRLVSYYRSGNRSVVLLCIPNRNGSAPTYEYRRTNPVTGEHAPAYYHLAGPTLGEWEFAAQWQAGLEALQAEYRDEADTLASLRQF